MIMARGFAWHYLLGETSRGYAGKEYLSSMYCFVMISILGCMLCYACILTK